MTIPSPDTRTWSAVVRGDSSTSHQLTNLYNCIGCLVHYIHILYNGLFSLTFYFRGRFIFALFAVCLNCKFNNLWRITLKMLRTYTRTSSNYDFNNTRLTFCSPNHENNPLQSEPVVQYLNVHQEHFTHQTCWGLKWQPLVQSSDQLRHSVHYTRVFVSTWAL